ncbi:hypothetical protein IE53DRAFT_376460 [Violaceomyces palustris]|uniref:Uncharacterized protein n=1 Tax=Violaceomyces palustris TaxID=1673888 RepID=A0ACD0P8U6_9BASI|nr:hypothetical protein IE53DRAFT_376460 [Violaceomyces palustris]
MTHVHLPCPTDDFFDIVPCSDLTSFQVGYLGLDAFQSWVKGDVLVKLDETARQKGSFWKCTIDFRASESVDEDDSLGTKTSIELFGSSCTLWDSSAATTSTCPTPPLPSTMPFCFSLTPDLPHCIHLRKSRLTYSLEARLHSSNRREVADVVKTVPVHLTRYSHPGPLSNLSLANVRESLPQDADRQGCFGLGAHSWSIESPVLAQVQLCRTIFRRAEPIDVKVRIPPPEEVMVVEKGLQLRSVEADFVRIITVKRRHSATGERHSENSSVLDSEGILGAVVGREADTGRSIFGPDTQEGPSSYRAASSSQSRYEALLAHSGKLCRFHSQRPVLLRLSLHPPFDSSNMPHPHPDHDALSSGPIHARGGGGGCESITQETVLHEVAFEVRIRIAILGGSGERRDVVCLRTVKILPGAAGVLEGEEATPKSLPTDKKSEKTQSKADEPKDHGKSSFLPSSSDAGSSFLDFDAEEEYDGYDDVGGEGLRHPGGVADMELTGNAIPHGSESSSLDGHAEGLEQLRQILENQAGDDHHGPPPTLQESQHDLQVEVEVEGVGLAMPRAHPRIGTSTMAGASSSHLNLREPYDRPPESAPDDNEDLPPPPALTMEGQGDSVVQPRDAWLTDQVVLSGLSAPTVEDASVTDRARGNSPPPPHSPPRPAYTPLSTDTYSDLDPSHGGLSEISPPQERNLASGMEPPPYAVAHSRLDRVAGPESAIITAQSSMLGSDVSGQQLISNDLDLHPPAYGQNSHPRSLHALRNTLGDTRGVPPGYED